MKKIFITTLGCKVNQYESASFLSTFEDKGHRVTHQIDDADIIVVNTCCVTAKAAQQSRQEIHKAARRNPQAEIVITGCYAQLDSDEISSMTELQNHCVTVIGNADKHLLVETSLHNQQKTGATILCRPVEQEPEISPLPVSRFDRRTRAYLKIQDGCNAFCSYCIVPYTRGRSRSLPVEDVLLQAKIYQEQGFKEIVITGIHVGYYGNDLKEEINITGIMELLCQTTPDIRYRLSSIEPLEVSDELLDCMVANPNFMPHLHIPLQSPSDEILFRMNRRYTTDAFAKILHHCHSHIEDIAIGIDLLAGFPGESELEFEKGLNFLRESDFTYLHVFPYSRRPGTPAANFAGQIAKDVKQARVSQLRKLSDEKKQTFYKRFIGQNRPLLVEERRSKDGSLRGFTDNYIPVSFQGDDHLIKTVVSVRLDSIQEGFVKGSLHLENYEG